MQKALNIANNSGNDIPVGAVIVKDNLIIASAHNEKEKLNDVTAHAEILAIRRASHLINDWRLNGCDLYVTLEPCPMCASAIMQARLKSVYFGSFDTVCGAFSVLPDLIKISNSKLYIKGGIMEQECDKLLKAYFDRIREKEYGH